MILLDIRDLNVSIGGKKVLGGVDLKLEKGKIHFLMGPNGSGKSALAFTLAGHPSYKIAKGKIIFQKKEIQKLPPQERARMGFFLALQTPLEVEGVGLIHFLKESLISLGRPVSNVIDFQKSTKRTLRAVGLKDEFSERHLNAGFSGGERKKSEMLQLLTLQPKLAVLDEIDSGLDIDSLKKVSKLLNGLRKSGITLLVITHLERIAKYLRPDVVYVLCDGKIISKGGKELLKKIEKYGYRFIEKQSRTKPV